MGKEGRKALEAGLRKTLDYYETEFYFTLAEVIGVLECIKISEYLRVDRDRDKQEENESEQEE